MRSNRLLCLFYLLLALCILGGCATPGTGTPSTEKGSTEALPAGTTQPPVPTTDYSEKTFYPAEILESLKIHGRSAVVEKSVTCDWPASGIEFTADCKGDIYFDMTTDEDTYLTVSIDGTRVDDVNYNYDTNKREGNTYYLAVGSHRIKIASDLAEGPHTVQVLKQNMKGNTSVDAIVLSGELKERPDDRELYIEFIGDSITCGYANLGINKTDDAQNAETTEGTATYAYLTAQALGADHSMVSVSGIGLYKGFTEFNMPDIYPYICYRRDQSVKDYQPARKADVVVINLGTNDESRIGTNTTTFKEHVERLIGQVREIYSEDTPIVFCYNSMKRGKIAPNLIQEVVDAKGGANAGLYSLVMTTDVSTISPSTHTHNGAPGNHPNAEQHQKQADTLTAFLKEILK